MTSLRKQLLVWIAPVFLIAAVIAAACNYFAFGVMVRFFMDNQLHVMADSHAAAASETPVLRPLTAHSVEKGAMVVQIWDKDGRLLTSSLPDLKMPLQAADGFYDTSIGSTRWRVYSLRAPDRTVQAIQNQDFRDGVIGEHTAQVGIPIALMIPVTAVVLWFAIQFALRRLRLVANAAAAQDERTLAELPIEHVPEEIRPLVTSVNTLLARLRDAFASQRRFVQDAAHELRTPITALSLQLENLKNRALDRDTAAQVAQFEAGLNRAKRMVEQLLRLARQETPPKADSSAPVELAAFLATTIGELMPLADRRNIDLGLTADIAATIRANPDDLRSLAHNLIDNALRYTPPGGVVDVKLCERGGTIAIEIVDSGPGIAEELLPRVFDRFFRIENLDAEGSGLGLAIAKNAAERNGISIELTNRTDGSGIIARLTFSAAAVVERTATTQRAMLRKAAAS
jgi:two-component system, OmpR family, sensor kinase